MWTLRERVATGGPVDDEVVLPFERRQHSRLRVPLVSGGEAAILLPRGTRLRHGDVLGGVRRSGEAVAVRVVAAKEEVYVIRGTPLVRAAYHLGNRHVQLEIGEDFLRMGRDPVLRDMVERLGFSVSEALEPFEPEAGAYGHGHGPRHGDAHSHGHGQAHVPGHSHDPAHAHGHEHEPGHSHDPANAHGHEHGPGHSGLGEEHDHTEAR